VQDCDSVGFVVFVPQAFASVQVLVCKLPEHVLQSVQLQDSTQVAVEL
jgi:hypothetical protein